VCAAAGSSDAGYLGSGGWLWLTAAGVESVERKKEDRG
jgi:hypothetical protein